MLRPYEGVSSLQRTEGHNQPQHQRTLQTFRGVSIICIRLQRLELDQDQVPRVFAQVVTSLIEDGKKALSLEQAVHQLSGYQRKLWLSQIRQAGCTLYVTATQTYSNIRKFKAAEELLYSAADDESVVHIDKQALQEISSMNQLVNVAHSLLLQAPLEPSAEYHQTFTYHIAEDAILRANGWENLEIVDQRIIPIEDAAWREEHLTNLMQCHPMLSMFTPEPSLAEYGIKLCTLNQCGSPMSKALRMRLTAKALRGRVSLVLDKHLDYGHAFCIAMLLISLSDVKEGLEA